MSPASELESLLQPLRSQVSHIKNVPAISDRDYMRCHIAFESASDQQSQILDWLVKHLTANNRSKLSIASVGAGSGILDIPLIARVSEQAKVCYYVIEPIEEQCTRFQDAFASSQLGDKVELHVINARIEEVSLKPEFDYVLAIHSLYYMGDVDQSIGRMMGLLKSSGELVMAVAPLEEMNLVAEVFWSRHHPHSVWFERDVVECLVKRGSGVRKTRIDGHLHLTPDTLQSPSSDTAIVDFLIQTQFKRLPQATRQLIVRYLNRIASFAGGRVWIPHPVTMSVVS